MVLDNDTRGWIMTAVSGIGMFFPGKPHTHTHTHTHTQGGHLKLTRDTACTFGGENPIAQLQATN